LGQVSSRIGIVSAACYTIGTTLGAALLGTGGGGAGAVVRWLFRQETAGVTPPLLYLMAGVALIGGAWDLGFIPWRVPGCIRQLPRHYMQGLGPYKTGFLWGLYLGMGYRTRPGYALYYVLLLFLLGIGSLAFGATVMAFYGFSHGLLILIEVAAVCAGASQEHGLLGRGRFAYLTRITGAVLLMYGVLLLANAGGRF